MRRARAQRRLRCRFCRNPPTLSLRAAGSLRRRSCAGEMASIREIDGRIVAAGRDFPEMKPRSPGTRGGKFTSGSLPGLSFFFLASALRCCSVAGWAYSHLKNGKEGVAAACAALLETAARATWGAEPNTLVIPVVSGGRETPDPNGLPLLFAGAVAAGIDARMGCLVARRPGVAKLPSGSAAVRDAHLKDASFFTKAGLKVLEAAVRGGCRRLLFADDDVGKGATARDVINAARKALKHLHLDHLEIRIDFVVLFRVVDANYPDDLRDELDVPTHDARVPASRRARRTRSTRAATEALEAVEAASIGRLSVPQGHSRGCRTKGLRHSGALQEMSAASRACVQAASGPTSASDQLQVSVG